MVKMKGGIYLTLSNISIIPTQEIGGSTFPLGGELAQTLLSQQHQKRCQLRTFFHPSNQPIHNNDTMQHWSSFQKQQNCRLASLDLPIDAEEFERQRRKQDGMCSVKSLFCCLSVLIGRPSLRNSANNRSQQRSQQQQQHVGMVASYENDGDSFGYNFDTTSPRVLTRLANNGHNFD